MDNELLQTDFYSLTKDRLITLIQKYNIQVDQTSTVRELRAIAAILKAHLQKASADKYYEQLLASIIQVGTIHPYILEKNPVYQDLQDVFNNEPTDETEKLLVEQKTLYDQLLKSKRKATISQTISSATDLLTKQAPPSGVKNETTMATKIKVPLLTPISFAGLPTEDVNSFIDKFVLSAKINNWPQELQKTLIESYFAGVALNYFILYKKKNPEFTIEQLFTDLRTRFVPIAQVNDLQLTINTRIQDPTEDNMNFITSMEYLCKKWKPDIKEDEIISYILTSIKPDLCTYLTNYEITTLEELYKFVQKYEKQTMIRKINSTKTQNIPDQTSSNMVLNEIKQLRDSIHVLKLQDEPTFSTKNKQNFSNTQQRFQSTNQKKFSQNTRNKPQFSRMITNKPTYARNFQMRNVPFNTQTRLICTFCKKQGHTYNNCFNRKVNALPRNVRKNDQSSSDFTRNDNRNKTILRNIYCSICKRTNHTTTQCYFNPINARQVRTYTNNK